MDKILETINLHGGYGPKIKILHGVDIHVKKKEIVCIIGPNGSGKSTLVKLIYGLITHHKGKVMYYPGEEKIDLTNIKSNKMVHNDIGFVPQRNNVFPSLTIFLIPADSKNFAMSSSTESLVKKSYSDAVVGI